MTPTDDAQSSDEYAEELISALESARESHREDCNSYGAGYDSGYAEGLKTGHALSRQQIVKVRDAFAAVLCDPAGEPCFCGSDGDRQAVREALAILNTMIGDKP